MRSHELEDLNLLLIRDAAKAPMWLDRWAVSYPSVHTLSVNAHDSIATWQAAVAEAWGNTNRHTVAVVAHGSGALALMAWLYQADILTQKALRATILAAPSQSAWHEDAHHTLQRARLNGRAALVVGANDAQCPAEWARGLANSWGARFFIAPQTGHLNGDLHGWQWGMKLLQEMLLS